MDKSVSFHVSQRQWRGNSLRYTHTLINQVDRAISPKGAVTVRFDSARYGLAAHRDVDDSVAPLFAPSRIQTCLFLTSTHHRGPSRCGASRRSESVSPARRWRRTFIYITVRINSISDSYIYVRHCPSDCHSSKEGMTTGVK